MWVEVEYTIHITEKGTAIINLGEQDFGSLDEVLELADTLAKKAIPTVAADKSTMKLDNTTVEYVVERFYPDDEGKPNIYHPIEKALIEAVLEEADGSDL